MMDHSPVPMEGVFPESILGFGAKGLSGPAWLARHWETGSYQVAVVIQRNIPGCPVG